MREERNYLLIVCRVPSRQINQRDYSRKLIAISHEVSVCDCSSRICRTARRGIITYVARTATWEARDCSNGTPGRDTFTITAGCCRHHRQLKQGRPDLARGTLPMISLRSEGAFNYRQNTAVVVRAILRAYASFKPSSSANHLSLFTKAEGKAQAIVAVFEISRKVCKIFFFLFFF